MKIYVGTLYSGENEYEECLASIQRQTFRNFDHFVFKNLPNKEAHATLYKSFLERANEYDALIKVDADMVLCSDVLFERIVQRLSLSGDLNVLAIGVHDFFSGQMINGLNAYRNTVRWDFEKETMFVDFPECPPSTYFYDDRVLAPAAIHCKNPAPWQAFHYGLHRGLKSIQRIHSTTHWVYLERVWANFQRSGDSRIGLAVLGAELVYDGKFKKPDADYTNPKMKTVLARYESMSSSDIEREIKRVRTRNWGFLPEDARRRVIRALRSKNIQRGIANELSLVAGNTMRRVQRRVQRMWRASDSGT
jgi:hypothetical protein